MITTSSAAADWLRLNLVHGIGPCTGRKLVGASGSVRSVWNNNSADWQHVHNVGSKLARSIEQSNPDQASHIIRQCESNSINIICPDDKTWPETFSTMDDAPLVLFVKGDPVTLKYTKLLAVVGARKASREGRMLTRRWCRFLSGRGIGTVSGMACGIDASAHGGTLEGNAPTIAVLGCGLLTSFSPEQRSQINAIAARGCVISEFLPTMEARPEHFPRRNRIIAGLAMATLVMEADIRSGSLITARQAIDYGRDVMAVPGSVLSGNHAGCHQLIRDGATLIESAEDISRILGWYTDSGNRVLSRYKPANASEAKIINALKGEMIHIDALAEHCGLTVPELSPILLALELLGVVEHLPGSRYTMGNR